MEKMVSVITPTYNSEIFIRQTIESVLNQTYLNLELIIVDDCSIDNTVSIVEEFQQLDSRVKLFELDANSGAAIARNYALEKAQGRYIAFLDSDDLWDCDKLEKQIHFMTSRNIGFSFTSYRIIKENGDKTGQVISAPSTISYSQLLGNTIIGCLTVVIDKKIIGDFRMPLIRAGQDTATWLSILKKGNIAYGYSQELSSYRIVDGSISSNKLKALKRTWNIYRNIEKLSLINSMFYFSCYVKNALLKRFK